VIFVAPATVIDPIDFTPSVSTLADGFVVYATASILEATYVGGTEVFRYQLVSDSDGIASHLACVQANDLLSPLT